MRVWNLWVRRRFYRLDHTIRQYCCGNHLFLPFPWRLQLWFRWLNSPSRTTWAMCASRRRIKKGQWPWSKNRKTLLGSRVCAHMWVHGRDFFQFCLHQKMHPILSHHRASQGDESCCWTSRKSLYAVDSLEGFFSWMSLNEYARGCPTGISILYLRKPVLVMVNYETTKRDTRLSASSSCYTIQWTVHAREWVLCVMVSFTVLNALQHTRVVISTSMQPA